MHVWQRLAFHAQNAAKARKKGTEKSGLEINANSSYLHDSALFQNADIDLNITKAP